MAMRWSETRELMCVRFAARLFSALLAAAILGTRDSEIRERLRRFRSEQTARVLHEDL